MRNKANADFRAGLIAMMGPLRGYARALAGSADAADDLVQQALVQALGAQHQFIPGTALRAWLFTILRHIWLSGMRRRARERHAMNEWQQEATTTTAEDAELPTDRLSAALRTLPVLHREALLLVSVWGLSGAEAARLCGVAEGTLRARVSRARRAMKDALSAPPSREASVSDHR